MAVTLSAREFEDNLISLLSMREASEIEFEFEKAQLDLKVPKF